MTAKRHPQSLHYVIYILERLSVMINALSKCDTPFIALTSSPRRNSSNDEGDLTILLPPKKRWTARINRTGNTEEEQRIPKKRPINRLAIPQSSSCSDDPVAAPTPSELEVAQTLARLSPRVMKKKRTFYNLASHVPKPEGMPPLFGSWREVQTARILPSETCRSLEGKH